MLKNDYKLDFNYNHTGVKYTLKACSPHLALNAGRKHGLFNGIYEDYVTNDRVAELTKFVSEADLNDAYDTLEMKNAAIQIIKEGGIHKVKLSDYLGGNDQYYIRSCYRRAVNIAIIRSPEYSAAEQSFQEWIKTRPGVRNSWVEYARKYNARHTGLNSYPVEPNLKIISEGMNIAGFRRIIECNRPDKFVAGQVVRLKQEYLNKRGKYPFYYNYRIERNSERVGTVLKKEGVSAMVNYGQGSREIRVLWFITGEETHVAEKCLSVV
jgi:hypothetical protein